VLSSSDVELPLAVCSIYAVEAEPVQVQEADRPILRLQCAWIVASKLVIGRLVIAEAMGRCGDRFGSPRDHAIKIYKLFVDVSDQGRGWLKSDIQAQRAAEWLNISLELRWRKPLQCWQELAFASCPT